MSDAVEELLQSMQNPSPKLMREQRLGMGNKAARAIWNMAWLILYRPTPRPMHFWRVWLLRLFGAHIGRGVLIYQSARIWAPWNLTMEDGSCLGDDVNCYNVDTVHLGQGAVVSQYCYLCTASHDYMRRSRPLVTAPIYIGAESWVAADVFISPGVTVGEGAVVGARSLLTKDVPSWTVVAGTPPRVIGSRILNDD